MDEIVTLAITFVLEALQLVIKNPTLAAKVKTDLVGVANDIYATYGMTPPATPATT